VKKVRQINLKDRVIQFLIRHFYNTAVGWTPAFQSYYSAGDEAEPYCLCCEAYLEDESVENYCPKCGRYLIWHEPYKNTKAKRVFEFRL